MNSDPILRHSALWSLAPVMTGVLALSLTAWGADNEVGPMQYSNGSAVQNTYKPGSDPDHPKPGELLWTKTYTCKPEPRDPRHFDTVETVTFADGSPTKVNKSAIFKRACQSGGVISQGELGY